MTLSREIASTLGGRYMLADIEVRNKIRNDRNLLRRVEITPKKGGTEWGKCKNEPFL